MTLKNTPSRAAILRLLRESREPLSAEEIHGALCREKRQTALSTVYRNLERFVEMGLIKTELFGDGVTRYFAEEQHGHYLICTSCQTRVRIQDCPLSGLEKQLEKDTGFSIERHALTLYGICPRCAQKEKRKDPAESMGKERDGK